MNSQILRFIKATSSKIAVSATIADINTPAIKPIPKLSRHAMTALTPSVLIARGIIGEPTGAAHTVIPNSTRRVGYARIRYIARRDTGATTPVRQERRHRAPLSNSQGTSQTLSGGGESVVKLCRHCMAFAEHR